MLDISTREKKVLGGGIIFVLLFLIFRFGAVPAFEKRKNLNRILIEKRSAIEEMRIQQQQFFKKSSNANLKIQELANRKKDFSLFSFLDSQVRQSGVKESVDYMKPFSKELKSSSYSVAIVKIKLSGVYLKELFDFLYRVESSKKGLYITSLSISKAGKRRNRLDAVIETQTLTLKDGV